MGSLWHLNDLRHIYRGTTPTEGKGLEIAAGRDGSVYVVGTSKQPGAHGNAVYQLAPVRRHVPSVAAVRIAVAPDGTLWHLNDLGDIYKGLQQIRGVMKMREIGIGADGSIYLISLQDRAPGGNAPGFILFRWFEPQGWFMIPDTEATKVAAEPGGYPWVLTERGEIHRRLK